jgi:hypothetical protein
MTRSIAPLIASFLGLGLAVACSDGTEAAALCGMQECPVGTSFSESRTSMMTYDIALGFNAMTYDADGAFKSFGSGSCEYFCGVIQACPEDTFPVITDSCFTCGTVTYDSAGEPVVSQGNCDSAGAGDETG